MNFFRPSSLFGFGAALLLSSLLCRSDSLWTSTGNNERPIFADRKACGVGDIVTIVVEESANQSTSQSKKTSTDDSIDASVTQFLFPSSVSKFGTRGGALPAIQMGGTTGFSGGGQVSNSQSITGRAAVLITDVLPNGNLVIEGVRRLTFSGETQHVVLHGLIRPDDISPANTIASSSIANARIEFLSEGELNDTARKGWFSKLYSKLRPF